MNKDLVVKDARVKSIAEALEKMKPQFQAVLPKFITPERMVRVVLTCVRTNPKLLNANPHSLFKAVMQAAQLGLEPGSGLNDVHLIPYKDEVQMVIDYKGYLELIRRSGIVSDVYAQVVYNNEPFHLQYGTDRKIEHSPLSPDERGDIIVGAYSVVRFKDGISSFNWMWREEIEKIRDRYSKSAKYDNSIWKEHEEAMFKKTVLRNHMKWLPKSVSQAREAATFEEAHDHGYGGREMNLQIEGLDTVVNPDSAAIAEKTDATTEKMKKEMAAEVKIAKLRAEFEQAGFVSEQAQCRKAAEILEVPDPPNSLNELTKEEAEDIIELLKKGDKK